MVFISGNLPKGATVKAAELAYQKSQEASIHAPVIEKTEAFAYTNFGEAGKVIRSEHDKELDVWQVVFDNKVRLNFKQTNFEAGQVIISARFGGGKLYEPASLGGIALFADSVFVQGGLVLHKYDALKRITAGKEIATSFSVGQGAFFLNGKTSKDDCLLQLQILAAYMTNPGYHEEAERQARKSYDELYMTLDQTAKGVLENKVSRYVAGGDFRFGYPDKVDLMKRNLDELKTWLNEPLSEGYIEISIVGDIDFEQAKKDVANTFGAIAERRNVPISYDLERVGAKFPKNSPEQLFTFDSEIPKAVALVYWPTAMFWDITRTRQLNLLASIFMDRLRLEIREKMGAGYSPFAVSHASQVYKDFGYLFAVNFCDPEKVSELTGIIQRMGREIGKGEITEDEFNRAIKPVLSRLPVIQRENGYWLNQVLSQSQYRPQVLEFAKTLVTGYEGITLDELNAVAKKYLGDYEGLKIMVQPN